MGTPSSSIFLSLSPEVLVEILFLLPARDIVACSRTCHILHTLVLETQLLQYVIYTHRAAVDDRFPPGLTIPQRFAFLERWEEAWRDSDGLQPSGGRFNLMNPANMKTQSMLRDGFLVVAHFKVDAEDEGIAGYSAIDLRSPATGWRRTDIPCHIIAFDCVIEQNLVATLHMDLYEGAERLLLTLWPFDDSLNGVMAEFGRVVFTIRKERFACYEVYLKIAGDLIGVMSCGRVPLGIDLFTLVDWTKKKAHNMLCGPAEIYAPSFAFIDHETVGHVNLLNSTIETRKIVLSGDGQISLELRKVLDVPVVRVMNFQLMDAVWSGDHPSIPVSSQVLRPDNRKHPPSALPFQSSLGPSVVSLAIFYIPDHTPPVHPEMQSVRAIIPRSELLDPHAFWTMRSFFSVPLSPELPLKCAISGTRWINRRLEVFDFNKIRFQTVQTRLRTAHKCEASPTVVEPASSNTRDEHSVKSWRPASLQYLSLSPLNKPVGDYDDVLADDERIVGLRYKDDGDDLHTKIVFDVHTLKLDGMGRWRNSPSYLYEDVWK